MPIKRIIGMLSIVPVLAWGALGQNGVKLSRDQVVAALNSIDRGLANRNAAAVVANFATNAVITATVAEGRFKDSTKHTSTEYREALEASLKESELYQITRSDVSVELSPDGKTAKVSSTLVEDYRFEGTLRHAVSKVVARCELIGGKVLFTRCHSEVNIK